MRATPRSALGYTPGMKTAVSIPADLFRAAERLAKSLKMSRSGLYAAALREYVRRYEPDAITEAMNRYIEAHGQPVDPAILAQGIEILRRVEW